MKVVEINVFVEEIKLLKLQEIVSGVLKNKNYLKLTPTLFYSNNFMV